MSNANPEVKNCCNKAENLATARTTVVPPLDVQDFPTEVQVHVELPGVTPEEVKLEIHEGSLILEGIPALKSCGEPRFLLRERQPVTFKRQIRLGDSIDTSGIWAEGKKCILTIHLPKKVEVQKRSIPVKTRES